DFGFVFLDGNEPFLGMCEPCASTAFALAGFAVMVARNALRILRHRRVLGVVEVFRIAFQFHEETGSVIIRRKDRAVLTNEQTTAVGNVAEQRDDVGGEFDGWLVTEVVAATGGGIRLSAVVPPECRGIALDLVVAMEEVGMFDGNFRFAFGE